MINKAEGNRYTAECADANCEWRIHASVLGDGKTWAIKSIRSLDHGCVGSLTYNPLATSEWVAIKLMKDIRANPDITGKDNQHIVKDKI